MTPTLMHASAAVYRGTSFARAGAVMLLGVACVLTYADIVLSHKAAYTLAEGDTGDVLAVAAGAAAFAKILLGMFVAYLFSKRAWIPGGALLIALLLFHVYSMQAQISLTSTSHDSMVSKRENAQHDRQRLQQRYDDASKRLMGFSGVRPSAQVKTEAERVTAALAAATGRADSAGKIEAAHASKACGVLCNGAAADKMAALDEEKALRQQLIVLDRELKASHDADAARMERNEASAALAGMTAVSEVADPQSRNIAWWLAAIGFSFNPDSAKDVATVATAKPITLILMVEFCASLLATGAVALWSLGAPTMAQARESVQLERQEERREITARPEIAQGIEVDAAVLPTPKASKSVKALASLKRAIAQDENGRVPVACRELAAAITEALDKGESLSKTAASRYLNEWHNAGEIIMMQDEANKWYATLPADKLAEARRRETDLTA